MRTAGSAAAVAGSVFRLRMAQMASLWPQNRGFSRGSDYHSVNRPNSEASGNHLKPQALFVPLKFECTLNRTFWADRGVGSLPFHPFATFATDPSTNNCAPMKDNFMQPARTRTRAVSRMCGPGRYWDPTQSAEKSEKDGARRSSVLSSKLLHKSRSATADPSTHHPKPEKRLGPRSLGITARWGNWALSNFDANF
jgi:hypothetical protein